MRADMQSSDYRVMSWVSDFRPATEMDCAWEVHLTELIAGQRFGEFNFSVTAPTAELAICRAALKAARLLVKCQGKTT